MMRLGFIGIGLMGRPMVGRLLSAGFAVSVWNRTPGKCDAVVDLGASEAGSIAELVANCDVIMMCVADTGGVEQIVFGDGGIARSSGPTQLVVDFSSIDPAATRDIAGRLQRMRGIHWVDAPVSGGVGGAVKGTLVIMAGGSEADVDTIRPLLEPLSQRVTRMGQVGAGQVTKVCNQLIVAANAMLIAEAVALAGKAGVDTTLLAPALADGFADSLPFQILAPRMSRRDHEPVQWKVATLLKDLDNARQLAGTTALDTPLAALARARMQQFAQAGNQDRDLSAIIELYLGPTGAGRT